MRRTWPVGVVACAVVLAACGGGDGDEVGFVAGQLALIPDSARGSGEYFEVFVLDAVAGAEFVDLDAPAPGRSADEIASWSLAFQVRDNDDDLRLMLPPILGEPTVWTSPAAFADDTGIDLGAATTITFATPAPPVSLTVLGGEFELEASLDELSDAVLSVGGGDDFEPNIDGRTDWNPIGRPMRLAERPGAVALSTSTPVIEDWVAGPEMSIAEQPDFAAAAAALDARRVVNAYLLEADFAGGFQPDLAADLAGIDAYSVVGIGIGPNRQGDARVAVAYVFDDEDAAAASLGALGALWLNGTSLMTGEPFDAHVAVPNAELEGRTVVVEFAPESGIDTLFPVNALVRRDVVFVHP